MFENDPVWELIQKNDDKNEVPFSKQYIEMLISVRDLHKDVFNAVEGAKTCQTKVWSAKEHNPQGSLNGGGVMTVMRGDILEKAAVNLSCVWGPSYPALEGEYAGKPFAAAGVSLISHPKNPNAPIMHMNIRCIQVFNGSEKTTWIGGGADLTPMQIFAEDTTLFHDAMKTACEKNPELADYEKYKKNADEYFYIPHRKESRGVGGIFFDYVKIKKEDDFSLLSDVGQLSADAYKEILLRRISMPYDAALLEKHLYWRGRYAEFNLVYDRGTRFGLMSGGNYEAIFCSLPPTVKW